MTTKVTFSILFFLSICSFAQETEIYETFEDFETSITENCTDTNLTFEDFDGILGANCNVLIIPDPDQECFGPNELEEGFTVQGTTGAVMVALEEGSLGGSPYNIVTENSILGKSIINFDPPVNAVAFSLWGAVNDTEMTEVTLFDTNNDIIESFDLTTPDGESYFFSAISNMLISRAETFNPLEDDPDTDGFEGTGGNIFGQLYFGAMGCTNLSSESFAFDEVSLYPNPAENLITINNPNNIKFSEIMMYDELGRVIKTIELTNNTIDLFNLGSGVYFLELSNDQGKTTKKIVKK